MISPRYWAWLGRPRTISVLLWLVTLATAAHLLHHSWNWFGNRKDQSPEHWRADGNYGHAQIDFGGQWVMGRMVVTGHARELYHRQQQWQIVREGYPVENEPPVNSAEWHLPGSQRKIAKADDDLRHDVDRLMSWFMGSDPRSWRSVGGAAVLPLAGSPFVSPIPTLAFQHAAETAVTPAVVEEVSKPAIGGPLYPPIHGFFYAPFGLLRPLQAYHLFQLIALGMIFVAGLGVKVLSRGRIAWSVATLVLLLYPGNRAGLDLAQNPSVTLAIAVWGWALASRGYNLAGGLVWGLLAFKPVWALALFLVPLMTRRWRFCAAMIAGGAGLCLATLPFVGIQTWFDWLAVGKEAADLYNVNQNWINLSRDLQSVPRRILHDFNRPEAERDTVLAKTLAWTMWSLVLVTTVAVYTWFGNHRRATGIGSAFLFLGAWLTCYHFMYYDALVSAAGCAVLFADPERFFRTRTFGLSAVTHPLASGKQGMTRVPAQSPDWAGPRVVGYVSSFPLTILALLLLVDNALGGMALEGTIGFGYYAHVTTGSEGATGLATPRVYFDTSTSYPWETFLVFLLWLWCGLQLVRGCEREQSHSQVSDVK